ncbi:FAD-binding domain-containing protein [Suillus hirtellus]|nr:FAD-binding domain-containing protein [Suillus hirtellus]
MILHLADGARSQGPADSQVNGDVHAGRANLDDPGNTCACNMGNTGKHSIAQGIHASIDYNDEPDHSDNHTDRYPDANYDTDFWSEEEYVKATKEMQKICKDSKHVSQFLRFGGAGYNLSVSHQFESSSEVARCAVQPGNIDDLKKIMKVFMAYDKVKFAVKGGGHSTNPGFSSTTGIQISMANFNELEYNSNTQNLRIGAGCLFDEVYKEIAQYKRNIVGGATAAGVGVAGWLLGGGYSLLTNQHGLGIDNLVEVQVVLCNGESVKASAERNSDLFFAIRGGGNNFGIVTSFTVKTYPLGPIYRNMLTFPIDKSAKVKETIMNFIDKCKDKKAAIVGAYRHFCIRGEREDKITVDLFYDGPLPSDNPFEELLELSDDKWIHHEDHDEADKKLAENFAFMDQLFSHIHDPSRVSAPPSHRQVDGSQLSLQTYAKNPPKSGVGEENVRARWGTVMVSHFTPKLLDEIDVQSKLAASKLKEYEGKTAVIDIWPFLPSMFDTSTSAAWPHEKGRPNGPLLACFQWEGESNDSFWIGMMKQILQSIQKVAEAEGCTNDKLPKYCNTSLADTPVQDIYKEHLPKLIAIRAKYDPNNMMGRTGGFRIPLAL